MLAVASNASIGAPSGSRCAGTGVMDSATAPDADAGVAPLVEAGPSDSISSGTGAQVMSWVPATPAACAGVVWHLEHTMSLVPSSRRSTGGQ